MRDDARGQRPSTLYEVTIWTGQPRRKVATARFEQAP